MMTTHFRVKVTETKSTHLLFLVLHLLLAGVDDLVAIGGVLVTHLEGLGRAEISPLPFSTSLLKMASKHCFFIEVCFFVWNRGTLSAEL